MLTNVAIALALVLLSDIAKPAELAIDARFQDSSAPLVEEPRVDVDPLTWWTGPEV